MSVTAVMTKEPSRSKKPAKKCHWCGVQLTSVELKAFHNEINESGRLVCARCHSTSEISEQVYRMDIKVQRMEKLIIWILVILSIGVIFLGYSAIVMSNKMNEIDVDVYGVESKVDEVKGTVDSIYQETGN